MEYTKTEVQIAKAKIDDNKFITELYFRLPQKYTYLVYTLYNKEFTDKDINDAKQSIIKLISDEIEKAFQNIKK